MSNETYVTLQGWLGSDVTTRSVGDTTVSTFRVGCTPRRFSRRTNEWFDAETQWYTVNAWRALGDNCRRSLKRSEPVIVHGKLNSNTWTNREGVVTTTMEVEATLVGHDLTRGQSFFSKTPRLAPEPVAPPAEEPDDHDDLHGMDVDMGTGEIRDPDAA